jgi:SAM-dependent methyltransferase
MPTLPSEHAEPHRQRQVAESFGSDPQRYDRTRPRYPDALVDRIAAGTGPEVLDIGCGTGIAARQFRRSGCRVLGVDVDARMADFARHGGLEVEVAAFEDWEPAGRIFDVVIAAQTWHWVDPVAGAVKAARVLRRGGRLAVFWNVHQPPPELVEAFAAVYRKVVPEVPVYDRVMPSLQLYEGIFTRAADGIRQAGAFGEPLRWQFDWQRTYTRDEWLDQVPTHGGHSLLPPDRLAELLAGIGASIEDGFTMRYTTVAVTAIQGGQLVGEAEPG